MEQTVTTALITAIIAVVIGALGLIGGVIGYVQGTAALRRATLTRQRAAAAEEAALQARTQAEQAARTAQSVLDRLTGLRSSADVADLPTGPLVLPPRIAAAVDGPDPSTLATAAVEPSSAQPAPTPVAAEPAPSFFTAAPMARRAEPDRPEGPTDQSLPRPAEAEEPIGVALPATGDPAVQVPGPAESTADPAEAEETAPSGPPAESQAVTGPGALIPSAPDALDAGPVPFASLSVALPDQGPSSSEPPARDDDVSVRPRDDAPQGEDHALATGDAQRDEPVAASADPSAEPEVLGSEPPVSQRSSTGQITAGTRGTAPMDWAEALRTGAIPLPARSRGTYSAPSKAKGQPVGPPRFEIRAVGRQRYEAVNVGGATAEQAALEGAGDDSHLVRPVEARPKPVRPGGSLAFSVLRVEGRQVRVRIAWMLNGDEEQAELPVP